MRKALIGILLAAGVSVPAAAWAQDAEEAPPTARQQRAIQHYERLEQRNQQRHGQRQERQERQERQQAVQSRHEQATNRHDRVPDRDGSRSGNSGPWLGDPNDPRMERHRRRYERLEQQNERSADRQDRERWERNRRADQRWDRGWRNDRRYDWYGYRNRYRDNYRLGRYYDPFGSSYRRFNIGIQIGRPFYSQRYWINDPWQYRLPRAYPGTQWVRYYDDVLLVDTWSGEVLDVIYNFFW